jgi:hypothetical protein
MIFAGAPTQQLITIYAKLTINVLLIVVHPIYTFGLIEAKQRVQLTSSPMEMSPSKEVIFAIFAINTV